MQALWIEDHNAVSHSMANYVEHAIPGLTVRVADRLEDAERVLGIERQDLVLLDWWLKHSDGETSIRRLRACGCEAPIVVVSGDERPSIVRRATELGAAAYVTKSVAPPILRDTLLRVLAEGARPPATLPSLRPIASEAPIAESKGSLRALFPRLTDRQQDVYIALLRGRSDKQIARDLKVSDTTVKSHVRAILQVVDVHSRAEAVYAAQSRGVLAS